MVDLHIKPGVALALIAALVVLRNPVFVRKMAAPLVDRVPGMFDEVLRGGRSDYAASS